MIDFSTLQIKAFKKLFAQPPKATGNRIPENFLLEFVLFEALVRLVGHYYRGRTGQRKKSKKHIPLDIEVVTRSFLHFHIQVSPERLALLLDSKLTKRNEKSARDLRNGLAHHWNAEDVKEVTGRYKTLSGVLTGVVDAIKARVHRAAK